MSLSCSLRVVLVVSILLASTARAACPSVNFDRLQKSLQNDEKVELVFFASWCSGCKKYFLENSPKHKRIYIASFDKESSVASVLKRFQVAETCYLDDGITDALKIQTLPSIVWWQNGKFIKL